MIKENKLIIILFIFAIIGFIDATYLSVLHFLNKIPPCSIGSCELVTSSQYAVVFGIPVALMGSLYYFALLFTMMVYLQSKKKATLKLFAYITSVGVLFTSYLVYLMIFVIKAVCIYCVFSAISTLILFITSWYIVTKCSKEYLSSEDSGAVSDLK